MSAPERPVPVVDATTAPHWEAARHGVLLVPACHGPEHHRFWPVAPRCPRCASPWGWATSPGLGTVYASTVVHRPATPGFEVPYVLAVVDLDDGWATTTNIVGCAPEDVAIGQRVEVRFVALDPAISLPCFAPVEPSGERPGVVPS